MKTLITATALALTLGVGGAYAQSDVENFDTGISMLELAASKEFSKLGLDDVDPMALSLNQLSLVKSIMASSDYNEREKEQQIRAIIANN